jgi:hypothetical protein
MGQSAAPPSRAQLLWHVAEKAAVLIGAAAFLHEAYPEAAPLQTDRAANGRSREAQNETQRLYMRKKRAADKAAKAAAP